MTLNDIDKSKVKYFGTEIEKVNDKKGQFKSFHTKSYVQLIDGTKYYIEDGITFLKQNFPHFESQKRIVTAYKKGKEKKATEWNCEIVEEGSEFIKDRDIYLIKDSIKCRKPFSLDHHYMYYYVKDNVFRDVKNDCLVYIDLDHKRIIRVDLEESNSESLEKWIKENIND